MPIMRNPFRKQDENTRPVVAGAERQANDTTTKAIDIKEKQPAEYKLSGMHRTIMFANPAQSTMYTNHTPCRNQ